MSLEFFDANACIGMPTKRIYKPAATIDALMGELSDSGISKALVWHIAQHDCSPIEGNQLLSSAIEGSTCVWGCWSILPPQTGEVIDRDFFLKMKDSCVVGLRAFPNHHNFMMNRVVFDDFLDEVTRRQIPLLLSLEGISSIDISWPSVYELLKDFPDLTCILCDIGIWPADRYTWPLLEKYPNVLIETSLMSLCSRAVESTVDKFGAGRLVFGSGFPARYAQASTLQLIHAEISDEDKGMIASGNLERVISQVKL